jgi:hypothetical protein
MKCIIKIDESGNAVEHPYTIDAFILSYPDLDISADTAPEGWAWFTRKNQHVELANTKVSVTQTVEVRYVKTDNNTGFQDEFYVHDLTSDEINQKIDKLKLIPPFPSWTLETDTYFWVPPVPKPENKPSYWDEDTKSWIIMKAPKEGKTVIIDEISMGKIPTDFTPEELLPIIQFVDLTETSNTSNT